MIFFISSQIEPDFRPYKNKLLFFFHKLWLQSLWLNKGLTIQIKNQGV